MAKSPEAPILKHLYTISQVNFYLHPTGATDFYFIEMAQLGKLHICIAFTASNFMLEHIDNNYRHVIKTYLLLRIVQINNFLIIQSECESSLALQSTGQPAFKGNTRKGVLHRIRGITRFRQFLWMVPGIIV